MSKTIEVMSSDGWIYDVMVENAKQFEKESGTEVKFSIYAPHVYFRALQTRLAAGEATDIFLMQSTSSYLGTDIDPEKTCIDLTGEEWIHRLKPEWLPSVSYKGKVYGLIIWDDELGWVYTYNDKLFKRLGLSAPRTYEEFISVCERIKKAGIVPVYEPGASRWHTSLAFFEMGSYFEERHPGLYEELNANRTTFAGYAPFAEALRQIIAVVNQGYMGTDFMADNLEGAKTALISGAAAMTLNKIGFARSVLKSSPDSGAESWGMFPVPWLDNRTVSIERSAPTWFGNARSRNQEAVKAFFRFLTRPDNLYRYAVEQPEGTSLSFPTKTVPLLPNEKAFFDSAKLGGEPIQGGVKYVMGQWMEIESDFEIMLAGGKSPEEFLKGVDDRRKNMAISVHDPDWPKVNDAASIP